MKFWNYITSVSRKKKESFPRINIKCECIFRSYWNGLELKMVWIFFNIRIRWMKQWNAPYLRIQNENIALFLQIFTNVSSSTLWSFHSQIDSLRIRLSRLNQIRFKINSYVWIDEINNIFCNRQTIRLDSVIFDIKAHQKDIFIERIENERNDRMGAIIIF